MPAEYFDNPDSKPSPMLDKPITDGRAWTRDTLDPQDCIVALGKAGLGEVSAMADAIKTHSPSVAYGFLSMPGPHNGR